MMLNVAKAVGMMKQFAEQKSLGSPTRVLVRDSPPWAPAGIGLEWNVEGEEPVRNAITCAHEDVAEIKRHFEEWIDSEGH